MKFTEFKIKNFKGIEDITFNLDKSPDANIYTLVGLNESGKTTILEAMNLFNPPNQGLSALGLPGTTITDFNKLIPISKRDNFNGEISIEIKLRLEAEDILKINEFVNKETIFSKIKEKEYLIYYRNYLFKDSIFQNFKSLWSGFSGCLKNNESEYIYIGDENYSEENKKLATFCRTLIPSILYFPNFLFDFPTQIFLETKDDPNDKEKFYIDLMQDILFSLGNDTNIKTHLSERIKSTDDSQKKNLDRLIQLMERKVTDVIFEAWNKIFKRKIRDTKVIISYAINKEGFSYLEFEIEAEDGIYQINERSLGFRWFFIFLLFTQFRPYRQDTPKNIMFLFDEPASNLHSSAQQQLLKSFENLMENCKIIYTTHSHHLINPNWLESTYVVKNEGLKLDDPESYNIKKTNVTIESYRDFVIKHPHNSAYFQPILDVLDYIPSNLESLPNCVFLEGKNDYYTLAYFQEVILSKADKINLMPSTGSGNLDTLISLYMGWGKEFIILFDSDKEGDTQKKRYIDKYGIIVESRIFTLEDIDVNWKELNMEKLFDESESLKFIQSVYPAAVAFNKTHFNRTIQESLINRKFFQFEEQTKNNISKTLTFLKDKLPK
ncbi:MAG: AAA family ATPase [Chitinophagales bacterium]|nr:AAA family ATPase [Chitinophagales bacterium]